jgi:hypothetical protein
MAAPRVATNARADAALVWEQAGAYHPFVRAANCPASARNRLAPVRVSAPGASEASVALDGSDDAFVIWQTRNVRVRGGVGLGFSPSP